MAFYIAGNFSDIHILCPICIVSRFIFCQVQMLYTISEEFKDFGGTDLKHDPWKMGRRGEVVKGVEHFSTIVLVNI